MSSSDKIKCQPIPAITNLSDTYSIFVACGSAGLVTRDLGENRDIVPAVRSLSATQAKFLWIFVFTSLLQYQCFSVVNIDLSAISSLDLTCEYSGGRER